MLIYTVVTFNDITENKLILKTDKADDFIR